jgi:predicted nucleic acid-binding protein
LANPRRVYWDSCVWISFLNADADRVDNCAEAIRQARASEAEIWTSSLTVVEVMKAKCEGEFLALEKEKDTAFENYIGQPFVVEVQVSHDIAIMARRLMRQHPVLKKPNDALHLATAVLYNCDEFHTYDKTDLLPLNGLVKRTDGAALNICTPPPPVQADLKLELTPTQSAGAPQAASTAATAAQAGASAETKEETAMPAEPKPPIEAKTATDEIPALTATAAKATEAKPR